MFHSRDDKVEGPEQEACNLNATHGPRSFQCRLALKGLRMALRKTGTRKSVAGESCRERFRGFSCQHVDLAEDTFVAFQRRQSRHMSGNRALHPAREWLQCMVNRHLLGGHGGDVIVLNTVEAVGFAVLCEIAGDRMCGIEDIIDCLFIRINRLICTGFDTTIITEIIILRLEED